MLMSFKTILLIVSVVSNIRFVREKAIEGKLVISLLILNIRDYIIFLFSL